MRALFLKDWYMAKSYCRSYLLIVAVFAAVSFISSESLFFMAYPTIMFGILPVTLISYDERFHWPAYAGTLPLRRRDEVREKYLLSLLLITFGQRLLGYLAGHLAWMDGAIRIWNYLRFALLALILFATLGILYALAQDERQRAGALLPGALCALAGWMALSVGFSYFVETFGNYSLIYGALGAVVVLMIWLYLSAATLIMGAEVNGIFCSRRGERRERPEAEGDQPPEQKEKEI